MGLTDRNRLGSVKRRQERLERQLNKQILKKERLQQKLTQQNPELHSASATESVLDPSVIEKAWQKYLHAKEIYKETKEMEHWRYAQECLSEYEDVLMQK